MNIFFTTQLQERIITVSKTRWKSENILWSTFIKKKSLLALEQWGQIHTWGNITDISRILQLIWPMGSTWKYNILSHGWQPNAVEEIFLYRLIWL